MAGALLKKPPNPPELPRQLMEAEYSDMFSVKNPLAVADCVILDEYLKKKAELKPSDHIVISEKIMEDEKKTNRLKIVAKYDEGRFAAIYCVRNESAVDDNVVSVMNNLLMMKTTLRNVSSNQSHNRIMREVRSLRAIAPKEDLPKRINPLLFEGRVLGVPFFVSALMDPNLEKCREEMGGYVTLPSCFFIAQEILMGIKDIHRKNFVHRDIKPTNIVLNPLNRNQWFIVDFGDSVGYKRIYAPPDGLTLPFLSREGHEVLISKAPSTFIQDIESWFYIVIDLIKPLEWKSKVNWEDVRAAKKKFWDEFETILSNPDYPPTILQIARLVKAGKLECPYTEVSDLLAAGFNHAKTTMPDWKPDWINRQATKEINDKRPKKEEGSGEKIVDNKIAQRVPSETSVNVHANTSVYAIDVSKIEPVKEKPAVAKKQSTTFQKCAIATSRTKSAANINRSVYLDFPASPIVTPRVKSPTPRKRTNKK
ncbi:unnamed protein product [Caenorhabditis bovis]|uniref:non-specific serine/threonine protein kinase n=1 Tax=Caenorhabditis bovis TaxID=2654633 RepID=A0A8S1FG91_9PELO|nr:unnamed protein product [Caenorhabditis bovis]